MKKSLLTLTAVLALAFSNIAGADTAGSVSGVACAKDSPLSLASVNINDGFPITISGAPSGAGINPPLLFEPTPCYCGVTPGVGITYWDPAYVAEIQRTAGCFESLGTSTGGVSSLWNQMNSEKSDNGVDNPSTNHMNVHLMENPLDLSILALFNGLVCKSFDGSIPMYMSEPDPIFNNDAYAGLVSAEGALVSSLPFQAACAEDSVQSQLAFPNEALWYCQGSWGSIYPFSANGQHSNSDFQENNSIMTKALAYTTRLGMKWTTIGPEAWCSAVPTPFMVKEQYRVDQVAPIPRFGPPLYIGGSEYGQVPTQANYPTHESTVNMLWEGRQCCAHLF